jgi:hypothetical protein
MLSCLHQFHQVRARPETGDSLQAQFSPSAIESWPC